MGDIFTHDPSPYRKSGTLGHTRLFSEIAEDLWYDTN